MKRKIYKYFPQAALQIVFSRENNCGIKCSMPKEYNDPFELFLGIDLRVGPEILASYRELIYELPQYPTTCFSRSPVVAPMWAHYAQNHSGFVLEFEVEAIKNAFPDVAIKDVTYRDQPDDSIAANLARAATTKKSRHAVWLQQAVLHHGYFSKYTMWSFEEECRLIADRESVEVVQGNDILFMPIECVTSLLVGKNFPEGEIQKSRHLAAKNKLTWYQSHIGKSMAVPFFRDAERKSFVFLNGLINKAIVICDECKEPFEGEDDLCPWCSITVEHEYEAALGNPFRMLEQAGRLDDYLSAVQNIQRNSRKS